MAWLTLLTGALSLASLAYVGLAIARLAAFRTRIDKRADQPPVTVLKPICGIDAELEKNLRSFCEQDYPCYQVVFGVASAADPAVAIVERVIDMHPARDLELVVEPHLVGSNKKAANLANMHARSKHELLVIADSDMRVGPDYLSTVAAAFADQAVGAATCLYKASPAPGPVSALAAAAINEWFLPSVLVAVTFAKPDYCFGATMAVRRRVLDRIGGFERLAAHLADDYLLGNRVAKLGYRVELVPYLVENIVLEDGFRSLLEHELRWARTLRLVRPLGYAFLFITFATPLSLIFLASAPGPAALGTLGTALALRTGMHYLARRRLALAGPARPWLAPVRDLLSLWVWIASFFGRRISWREQSFSIADNGELLSHEPESP